MSNDYFFVEPTAINGTYITIEGDEAKHIARVLRKQEGEMLWVADGNGTAYEVVIRSISLHTVECEIVYAHQHHHEPDIEVTLAVAQLKNPSRMEWIIEKGTELGVRRFIPLITNRTIAKSSKEERWQNIALAAMKQSGRCVLPQIYPPTKFETLLNNIGAYEMKLIPYERTDSVLFIGEVLRLRTPPRSVIIIIGPEGGFTEEEITAAEQANFMQVSLGRRRLRTETAAIVSAAWIIGNE